MPENSTGDRGFQDGSIPRWDALDAGTTGKWATPDDLVSSILGQPPSRHAQPVTEPIDETDGTSADDGNAPAAMRDDGHDGAATIERPSAIASGSRTVSEYGKWSDMAFGKGPDGAEAATEPTSPGEAAPERHGAIAGEASRPDVPVAATDIEQALGEGLRARQRRAKDDVTGRRGRFTSVLSVLLSLCVLVVAFAPVILRYMDQERWVLSLISSLPFAALLAFPATMLGLRSAIKPKGQLGRRRGIAAVIICSVALLSSAFVIRGEVRRLLDDLNAAGRTAKEQTSADTMSIIFPGGQMELDNKAIKVLMREGMLPDNTLDNGAIPISSQGGKIYVGSKEIDTEIVSRDTGESDVEASSETLRELADALEKLQAKDIEVTTDGENIVLKSKQGETRIVLSELGDNQTVTVGGASKDGHATPAADASVPDTESGGTQQGEAIEFGEAQQGDGQQAGQDGQGPQQQLGSLSLSGGGSL